MGILEYQITGPRTIRFKPINDDPYIIDIPTIHLDESIRKEGEP